MSPWGIKGGGPLNDQQIQTLIDYLKSIQIPRENCLVVDADPRVCDGGHLPVAKQEEIQSEAERLVKAGTYSTKRKQSRNKTSISIAPKEAEPLFWGKESHRVKQ